jgi:hypothetical protein
MHKRKSSRKTGTGSDSQNRAGLFYPLRLATWRALFIKIRWVWEKDALMVVGAAYAKGRFLTMVDWYSG